MSFYYWFDTFYGFFQISIKKIELKKSLKKKIYELEKYI